MPTSCGAPPDHCADDHRDHGQHHRHLPIDDAEHGDAADHRRGWRYGGPGQRVFEAERRICGCGDAAGESSREVIAEITRAMPREVLEQVDAEVTADQDKGLGRDPAGEPPQQIVAGDERQQESDRRPQALTVGAARSEGIDKVFDAVLRADGAADCSEHRQQHSKMAAEPSADVSQKKFAGALVRMNWRRSRRTPCGRTRTPLKHLSRHQPPGESVCQHDLDGSVTLHYADHDIIAAAPHQQVDRRLA